MNVHDNRVLEIAESNAAFDLSQMKGPSGFATRQAVAPRQTTSLANSFMMA